jgi:hypothetical protein
MEKMDQSQKKKVWVTPEILDSPVIAVTEGNPEGYGSDQDGYS